MSLEDLPVEDLEVKKAHNDVTTKIDSKEFIEKLAKELSEGKPWRTSKGLASKLDVDPVQLEDLLNKPDKTGLELCYRRSKEDGIFLYAILKRVDSDKSKDNQKVENSLRVTVTEEDRYAVASLHSAFILLDAAINKYAVRIHERNEESFSNLVKGKDRIEAGIALLVAKLKSDITKLPKV